MKKLLLSMALLFGAIATAQIFPIFGPVPSNPCGSPVATNMIGWFSADCFVNAACSGNPANGTVLANSTGFGTWFNRLNNGNDINSQISGATFATCTYVTGSINGLPTVNFPSNCGFGFSSQPDPVGTTTWAAFVVWQNTTTNTYGKFTGGSSNSGANNAFEYATSRTASFKEQLVIKEGIALVGEGTTAADTSFHQMNVVFQNQTAGNTVAFRLDRSADGSTIITPTDMTPGIVYIGLEKFNAVFQTGIKGNMAELLIYAASSGLAISSGNTTINETYLNCRYGL